MDGERNHQRGEEKSTYAMLRIEKGLDWKASGMTGDLPAMGSERRHRLCLCIRSAMSYGSAFVRFRLATFRNGQAFSSTGATISRW